MTDISALVFQFLLWTFLSRKRCRRKIHFVLPVRQDYRSHWPRGLRRGSADAYLLRLWVRIPAGAWMFVCCEYCVLSGRGFCDGLITCLKESYRLLCVVVCDIGTSWMRRPWPTGGVSRQIKKKGTRLASTYVVPNVGVAIFTSNGHFKNFGHRKFCKTGIISSLLKLCLLIQNTRVGTLIVATIYLQLI